jgi:uncharacterized membrane-anchored protein
VADVALHGDADPDVQLDLAPQDPAFQANAAAAGFILVFMTLAMNGLAIWLRYRSAATSSGDPHGRSQVPTLA